ncbi:MAG: NDP-sugar synthase [Methanomassiliicoccales archaeon]|nr:NDP-sugar synthase [Methanomassiliicoccales archaeon]
MKAVILAGGLGTRLRPLTYTVPKPLIPLVGKPLIVRMIESLPQSVDTVILAVSYMREALEDHFRVQPCGRKVIIVNEPSPMGTGGAIKNVAHHLDETFIAMNGDCISSLDLREMVKRHRECGGIGTIALWQVEDPSAFGVVQLDRNERIIDFQEKPKREEARSDLINAGYYVFEPEILDYIGKGQVSIEREVFPRVLGYGLFGHRFTGHWMDCGTRETFLAAQAKVLELESPPPPSQEGCCFLSPSLVRSANIRSATVGPNACIEAGAVIGEGAEVSGSLVMRGACLGPGCSVRGSIIGPNYKVGKDEKVEDSVLANR